MSSLSLSQMLDAALGSPSVVNYRELHDLLRAVLWHLGLQDVPVPVPRHSPNLLREGIRPTKGHPGEKAEQGRDLVMGLRPLVPGMDQLQGTTSSPQVTSVAADMGQMKKKMEVSENDISKVLLEEIGGIKAAQAHMEEDIQRIQEALGLKRLGEMRRLYPAPEDISNVGSCQVLGDSLVSSKARGGGSGQGLAVEGTGGQSAAAKPLQSDENTQRGVSSALGWNGAAKKWADTPSDQTRTSDASASTSGVQPESFGTQTSTIGMQQTSPSSQIIMPALPGAQEEGSSVQSICNMEMMEGLCQIRQLSHLYATLKKQVAQLAVTKLDHTELEKLHLVFPEGDQKNIASVLDNLRSQVSSLQGLASDLQGEKGKIRQLEDTLGKLQVAEADWKGDGNNQGTLQPGSVLQELKQELREQHHMTKAMLEQLVAKTADQLQVQLDELREKVESLRQEQAETQTAYPICSRDTRKQVRELLLHYEKLQEQVDSFMSEQAVGKVLRQPRERSQDKKLLKHIQATVVQLQGEYEKLTSLMGNLQAGSQGQQEDIEALFQSVERLEKEKADKEDLGVNVKANKSALGTKVSHSQFEASMERLHETMEKMRSRGVAQEQGLQQVQQQLRELMDCKLDRLELRPVQHQLEHCKGILNWMKDKVPQTEADDAAGIKYPLAHCHCLSCDHPLNMPVPGPKNMSLLLLPPMLHCLTGSTPTVLKPQETQQHGKRERVTECKYSRTAWSTAGQNTITLPLQRWQSLQPKSSSVPWPSQNKEIALLGQHHRICQGLRKRQQPLLGGKEGCAALTEDRSAFSNGHPSWPPKRLQPLRERPSTPTAEGDGQGELVLKK